jgi:CTP:molybdopterin cytidylyltransferase MocA
MLMTNLDHKNGKPAVVILAAGKSIRMGKPKPFLLFDQKSTFLEKVINVYKDFGIDKIILVVNDEVNQELMQKYPEVIKMCIMVINLNLDLGRFYSIKLGLDYVHKNEPVFIQDVDNPFISIEILEKLLFQARTPALPSGRPETDWEYFVPQYQGKGGHPVLLADKVIKGIKECQFNDLNFKEFLKLFRKGIVKVDDSSILVNINTPDDYKKYFLGLLNTDDADAADLHG